MDEFYTINQAAVILKVHPLTVRRYIKERKLKAYRAGGNIRVAVNDLKNFTQSFIPRHRNVKSATEPSLIGNRFSFNDPIFTIRGKGLSLKQ